MSTHSARWPSSVLEWLLNSQKGLKESVWRARSAELGGVFAGHDSGQSFFTSSWRVQFGRVRQTRILAAIGNDGLEPRSGDPGCGFGENAQIPRDRARNLVDGIASSVLRGSVSDCGGMLVRRRIRRKHASQVTAKA